MRALVIGGGFGGMASALRLRALGYDVELLEKLPNLGGRGQVFKRDGYTYDAGPTVITAPFIFDELFQLFDEVREDHIKFVPLSPWYRFYYQDGSTFDYGGTLEETLSEIRKIHPPDESGYLKLVEHSKAIFEKGFIELADASFHKFSFMLKQVPSLIKLRADRTVWEMVCHYLEHPKLRQAFSIQPLLVGGNPFSTTSIYALIHYLERAYGIHFALGGTGAIVKALEDLMCRVGVEVKTDTQVTSIDYDKKNILSVISDKGRHTADLYVYNGDPLYLYKHLIPNKALGLLTKSKRNFSKRSMGLYVLFFGTSKKFSDVAHHTIWLGTRYKELLEEIFNHKSLPDDFSLYVHRPTATDPSFAPKGHDSFYVLAPVPNQKSKIDWRVEEPKLRAKIISALDSTILPGLKTHISAPFSMTPDDFADDYLSVDGAGFSIAPNLTQSAWFRFHNKAEDFDNLLLCGAGTHPGAGLPGVISSAKVVEKLAKKYMQEAKKND